MQLYYGKASPQIHFVICSKKQYSGDASANVNADEMLMLRFPNGRFNNIYTNIKEKSSS